MFSSIFNFIPAIFNEYSFLNFLTALICVLSLFYTTWYATLTNNKKYILISSIYFLLSLIIVIILKFSETDNTVIRTLFLLITGPFIFNIYVIPGYFVDHEISLFISIITFISINTIIYFKTAHKLKHHPNKVDPNFFHTKVEKILNYFKHHKIFTVIISTFTGIAIVAVIALKLLSDQYEVSPISFEKSSVLSVAPG